MCTRVPPFRLPPVGFTDVIVGRAGLSTGTAATRTTSSAERVRGMLPCTYSRLFARGRSTAELMALVPDPIQSIPALTATLVLLQHPTSRGVGSRDQLCSFKNTNQHGGLEIRVRRAGASPRLYPAAAARATRLRPDAALQGHVGLAPRRTATSRGARLCVTCTRCTTPPAPPMNRAGNDGILTAGWRQASRRRLRPKSTKRRCNLVRCVTKFGSVLGA